jgi:hypothetical protein
MNAIHDQVRDVMQTLFRRNPELCGFLVQQDLSCSHVACHPALDGEETRELIEAVSRSFHEHSLKWARVRYDDEERVFKANGNGHRAPDQSTGSGSGSASPAMR